MELNIRVYTRSILENSERNG